MEQNTVLVGVGLDYETEQPHVWTGEKVADDCEDCTGWYAVEVPVELVEAFKEASHAYGKAIDAIHEYAGYDSAVGRLGRVCAEYTGDSVTTSKGQFWDPCDRCGWERDDHGPVEVVR